MSDQTGTSNISISLDGASNPRPPFLFSPESAGKFLGRSYVYKGNWYVVPISSTGIDGAHIGAIYKANTDTLGNWTLVANSPAALRTTSIAFDEIRGIFYHLGGITTGNSYFQTTFSCDLENGAFWSDSAFNNLLSITFVPYYSGFVNSGSAIVASNNKIYYMSAYSSDASFMLFEVDLNKTMSAACVPSKSYDLGIAVGQYGLFYSGDYIHIIATNRTSTVSTTGSSTCNGVVVQLKVGNSNIYNTTSIRSVNIVTGAVSDSVITPLPFWWWGPGTICQFGSVVYATDTGQGLRHYYDTNWGYGASWRYLPPLPNGFNIYSNSSIAVDKDKHKLYAISNTGLVLTLELDPLTHYPSKPMWEYDTYQFGSVSALEVSTPNIPILVSTGLSKDIHASAANINFVLTTNGYRILNHTVTYQLEMPIILTTNGTGSIGIASVGNTDVPFLITTSAYDQMSYGADFVISLETATNLSSVFAVVILGDVTSNLETSVLFSAASGILATLENSLSTDISLLASQQINGVLTLSQNTTTVFENKVIFASLNIDVQDSISFNGWQGIVATLLLSETDSIYFSAVVQSTSEIDPENVLAANRTVVMNTKTVGISEYSNYNFNSFFKLGGVYYGCSSTGLYKLEGDKDNTQNITGIVSTPVTNFDSHLLKNIRDAYVYIRSNGDSTFALKTNEQIDRSDYTINYDNIDGIHRRRVKTAQGIKGTTWQATFTNQDGVDFDIKQVDLIPRELSRSI